VVWFLLIIDRRAASLIHRRSFIGLMSAHQSVTDGAPNER